MICTFRVDLLHADKSSNTDRTYVLDVSRLVWRGWTGRLPTGIDRVCLAYVAHFGAASLAMIQRGPHRIILDARGSAALFALLARGGANFRHQLVRLLARAPFRRHRGGLAGKVYLNIGHTGLDEPSLSGWLRKCGMRPLFLIHDLIPITHPQFCRDAEAPRHARRMGHALDCAAGIIANSQDTLRALQAFAGSAGRTMPPATVAWLGVDELDPASVPASFDRPHFAMVGTIEGRKNHILLLRLWERLAARLGDQTPLLVIVGQRGWKADEAISLLERSAVLNSVVREMGRCNDDRLAAIMRSARALLMPSFAEGFGLPVIEALQRGVPVIASQLPVFQEVVGAIPLYLDPGDAAGWEAAIVDFVGQSDERDRQLQAMGAYRAPSWAEHFAKLEALLAGLRN